MALGDKAVACREDTATEEASILQLFHQTHGIFLDALSSIVEDPPSLAIRSIVWYSHGL